MFEWEATRYIIGVDFYIVTLRLISLTDSFNTIVYLLLKQNGCHCVQSLYERCSLRNRQCPFRTWSTKAGTIPPRNILLLYRLSFYPERILSILLLFSTVRLRQLYSPSFYRIKLRGSLAD